MFSTIVLLSTVSSTLGQIIPMNTFPFPGFGGNQLQMPMGYSNSHNVERQPQRSSGDSMMMNPQFGMGSGQFPSSFLAGRMNMPSMGQMNMVQRQVQGPQFGMPSMNAQMNMPQMNSQLNMAQRQIPSSFMNPQFNMRPRQLAAPMSSQTDAQQSTLSSSESLPDFLQDVNETIVTEVSC